MIVCIQSPPELLMMQDHKSYTPRWLRCTGWGTRCVSFVFSYIHGRFIRKGRWYSKGNILQLIVDYLNGTINRKSHNTEPEIGTDGSSQMQPNPWVDRYRSWFPRQEAAGWGFGWCSRQTEIVFRFEPEPVPGYPDLLLSVLTSRDNSHNAYTAPITISAVTDSATVFPSFLEQTPIGA
jgi:hypothetical protein